MKVIICDRCKNEYEIAGAYAEEFREIRCGDNFCFDLCGDCINDLRDFVYNKPTEPRQKINIRQKIYHEMMRGNGSGEGGSHANSS